MTVAVVLKTGQKIESTLASPFRCEENEIVLVDPQRGGKSVFSLDEVAIVLFTKAINWGTPDLGDDPLEVVETMHGDRYQVRVNSRQSYKNGFYGLVADDGCPYRTIFFTLSGVKLRDQQKTLGDILQEQGAVSQDSLKEVLNQQQELRSRRVGEIIAESANLPQEVIEKALQDAAKKGTAPKNARVGDILIEAGLVTREQVEQAFASQEAGKKLKVGELLINKGLITENQLLSALATKFQMRFVDLETITPTAKALKLLSEGMVKRLQVLPLETNGRTLVVATSSPTDASIGDDLRFTTNCNIELVVATPTQIAAAIDQYYGAKEDERNSIDALIGEMHEDVVAVEEELTEDSAFIEPDSKVITLINKVLIDAHKEGASDIHFEPGLGKSQFIIRYRIDGECHVAHRVASTFKNALISRLKILSNLDIAERRKPQSGKILLKYEGKKLEYRVEITPTVGNQEDAVLRLLAASKPLPLASMGFSPTNLANFTEVIGKPYGLVLCVGPTGSGKTTTLHSALGHINQPQRKIWTAEDPVEITQPGLRQVQVNPKIGFTFQDALRSFLRADPDVIMIGEMRDVETAKIAIEASLTGHLVFSTLHTNSAPETVVRLIDMGMDPFNFADALLGVVAQRLARRLCEQCRKPYQPTEEEYGKLVREYGADRFQAHGLPAYSGELRLMGREGCDACGGTGYRGRLALHELLVATLSVKQAVRKGAGVEQLRALAIEEGMRTLKMDGVQKVFAGLTDFEQIAKVCL